MTTDIWHYSRRGLAEQVLGMFESGLSSALVFFAPRRMGKTEFLLKDMQPLAKQEGWDVLYFSFLDAGANAKQAFTLALADFAVEVGAIKWDKFHKQIKKIEGGIAGVRAGLEFHDPQQVQITLKEIITSLAKKQHRVLLLLDEVQVLAQDDRNKDFIAALRTVLDMHKDFVKVIFTGSSQEGLRRMFSKSDAPFFHFGQNLPFPELQKEFIEHLAQVFHKATRRKLDVEELWQIFIEMDKVPQLIRSLVERLVLHPDLTLQQAKQQLLEVIAEDRQYIRVWDDCSVLECLLLKAIVISERELFSEAHRLRLAKEMGVDELPLSTVQSAIRTLKRKEIIGSLPERGLYYIEDPNFKSWIERVIINGEAR
ncbi:MAG: hypothetical protein CMF50_04920 [Legionellales bacterium]|nr:hypothetical protein [Legionellales bacterium]|tara:strand:- start:31527 stop:32633 length:1107 start_codon:yes stop_codon:yes gene_type:complete